MGAQNDETAPRVPSGNSNRLVWSGITSNQARQSFAGETIEKDARAETDQFSRVFGAVTRYRISAAQQMETVMGGVDTSGEDVERLASEHDDCASGFESQSGRGYAEERFHQRTAATLRALVAERDRLRLELTSWQDAAQHGGSP